MVLEQTVNKVWAPLYSNDSRYVFIMGGRGAGRSYAASQYALAKLNDEEYFRCAIMRAVHGDIRQSLWREFIDRVDEQGVRDGLHIVDNEMKASYGANSINAVGFKASSSSHSAKLKSLANYNCVIIEEAEEIGEAEFRKLDDSLRTVKGPIKIVFLLNTPPKSHWIIQRWFDLEPSGIHGFYTPRLKAEHTDATFLYFNHRVNLANLDAVTVKRYNGYRDTDPAYYYQVIEGLCPDTVRGRIYRDWKLIDEIPHEARLVRFGLDFGWFPDPAALVAIYYYNGGYIIDEIAFGTEIPNQRLAEIILSQPQRALTVADSAEPKSIDQIRGFGVDIVGTEKGADSVVYGINCVSQMRVSVTRRSTNVWTAYENYAWAETKDGVPKGVPSHYLSDCMDGCRYGLVSMVNTINPEQAEQDRVMNHMRAQQNVQRSAQRLGL